MANFRITPHTLSHKLKLHQLQIFERVLARRSLSRAASELHLTQPTVTRAIHDLEAFSAPRCSTAPTGAWRRPSWPWCWAGACTP